jgi:hypothetical protein
MQDEPLSGSGISALLSALCTATVHEVGVSGAWVTVMGSGMSHLLYATDSVAARLADIEFTLGEGPGVRAGRSGRLVMVPDVHSERVHVMDAVGEGPITINLSADLVEAARQVGVASVFAFPLQVGAVRLGVLELYSRHRGPLDAHQLAAALRHALAITHALLGLSVLQSDGDGGGDGLDEVDLRATNNRTALSRAVVHQATGMLMVQLGTSIDEAFTRLRAHAFAEGLPITEIAELIVDRRLRLERD